MGGGRLSASILLTVVYNPYGANLVEWLHEGFLVAGGLIVGFVVGRNPIARTALRTYLFLSMPIAVWACIYSVTHHFEPANLPFGMQKNFVGDTLCFVVIIAYCRPDFLQPETVDDQLRHRRWPGRNAGQSIEGRDHWLRRGDRFCVASQSASRPAIAPRRYRLSADALHRLQHHPQSAALRQQVQQRVHAAVGIPARSRYLAPIALVRRRASLVEHDQSIAGAIQPPNAEFEMLTSAGIIGLLGLAALLLTMYQVSRRLDPRIGTVAVAVLIARIVQGELDLFWVGALGGFPFLICGLCIGADRLSREKDAVEPAAAAAPSPLRSPEDRSVALGNRGPAEVADPRTGGLAQRGT